MPPLLGLVKKTAVLEVTNIWGMPHGKEGWLTEGRCGGRRLKEVRYGEAVIGGAVLGLGEWCLTEGRYDGGGNCN